MVRLHSGPVEPAHALPVSSVPPLESDACAVPPTAEAARKSVHYTKGFYGCIEAQGRGSLHLHSVIWIEGALNPNEIKRKLVAQQDHGFETRLIRFLETNISSCIPADPSHLPQSTMKPVSWDINALMAW